MTVEMVYGRRTLKACLLDEKLDMHPADFQDVVVEVWHDLWPDMTDEEILCEPTRCAIPLIQEVRKRVGRRN